MFTLYCRGSVCVCVCMYNSVDERNVPPQPYALACKCSSRLQHKYLCEYIVCVCVYMCVYLCIHIRIHRSMCADAPLLPCDWACRCLSRVQCVYLWKLIGCACIHVYVYIYIYIHRPMCADAPHPPPPNWACKYTSRQKYVHCRGMLCVNVYTCVYTYTSIDVLRCPRGTVCV